MASLENAEVQRRPSRTPGLQLGLWSYGIVNLILIFAVSLVTWYWLADPVVSSLKLYPQPFAAILFWMLMTLILLGFNTELYPFNRLKQPLAGLLAAIVGTLLALAIVWFLTSVIGSWDPAFAAGRPNGLGYLAAALWVLMGFFTWSTLTNNWGHWPWVDLGLKQPVVGIAEFLLGFFLAVLGYVVLIYPNLATWADPQKALLPLPTVIGWYYSVIVSMLLTVVTWENWPWSSFNSRAGVAIGSFFGNFVLGTVIYYVFLAVIKGFLTPAPVLAKLGDSITLYPAELGVGVVLWILVWGNLFGNYPTHLGKTTNMIVRTIVVLALAVATYLGYYNWFAVKVLHEPVLVGNFGGDALIWIDWVILVLLYYVVYFGTYGLVRRQ